MWNIFGNRGLPENAMQNAEIIKINSLRENGNFGYSFNYPNNSSYTCCNFKIVIHKLLYL